jgi:hypothetical protein
MCDASEERLRLGRFAFSAGDANHTVPPGRILIACPLAFHAPQVRDQPPSARREGDIGCHPARDFRSGIFSKP